LRQKKKILSEKIILILDKGGIAVFHDLGWNSVRNTIKDFIMPRTKNHNSLPNMWWGEVL
jgi:hypothetical protein